jgi:hypothetical protein
MMMMMLMMMMMTTTTSFTLGDVSEQDTRKPITNCHSSASLRDPLPFKTKNDKLMKSQTKISCLEFQYSHFNVGILLLISGLRQPLFGTILCFKCKIFGVGTCDLKYAHANGL